MTDDPRFKIITTLFDASRCILDERTLSEIRIVQALAGRTLLALNSVSDVRETFERMREKGLASRVGYDLWEVMEVRN